MVSVSPNVDREGPTYSNVVGHTFYNYPPFFGCSFTSSTCSTDSGTIGPAGQSGVQTSRFDFFQSIFNSQVAAGNVPSFSYLTLPNDHTDGVDVNYPSPRALVADNDLGLGQIVDLISHSSIWSSSAIFVMEDDSQDGADHVDAHRMPGYVISPWVRTGGVISTRYDQLSMMRTAELMVGAHPLSLSDALATPMNDAFTTTPNSAPYQAITPQQSLDQRNSAATARGIDALLPITAWIWFPRSSLTRPCGTASTVLAPSLRDPARTPHRSSTHELQVL